MDDPSQPDDPSDIPDPTLEQLLPTMYISDRQCVESRDFPWAQREAIIEFYSKQYKEGQRRERDKLRQEQETATPTVPELPKPEPPKSPYLTEEDLARIDSMEESEGIMAQPSAAPPGSEPMSEAERQDFLKGLENQSELDDETREMLSLLSNAEEKQLKQPATGIQTDQPKNKRTLNRFWVFRKLMEHPNWSGGGGVVLVFYIAKQASTTK